jgi:two-component system, LytTR family, response regulator
MQISCIAIEDEPLALSKLEGFIEKVPELKLAHTFDNALEAIGWLKENSADLIFLDIRMEQLTGIEFLEASGVTSRIIIITAYDQYAVKGFELNVSDYVLKPYSFKRFLQAVGRVMDFYSKKQNSKPPFDTSGDFIFVKTEYRLERIDLDSILYIEGMKDYLRIVCNDKKIMTLQSFSKLEESLPANNFCRVHKSFVVALDKIKSIERGVIIIADQRIPVSNTYRDGFYSKIQV